MDRESRVFNFPPDTDELNGPARELSSSLRNVDAASKKIRDFARYCADFPAVGSERAKVELLDVLADIVRRQTALRNEILQTIALIGDVEGHVTAAFHDPSGVMGQPQYVAVAGTKVAVDDPRWRA